MPGNHPIQLAHSRLGSLRVYAAVVLGYILLLPPQLNLSIFGSVLPPYRFFLIPALLFVLFSYFKGRLRIAWPDILVIAAAGWISLALFMTTERTEAFTASFAQITDIALAYLFGRAAFLTLRDVRIFLLLMLPGIAVVGTIMAIESIANVHIVQPFFAELTGQRYRALFNERLGLMRSSGVFPHPILAGIFMASFLPLYFLSGLKRGPMIIGSIASFASFFSVSSAALLALAAGGGLIAYNWLSEQILNLSWRIFFIASGLLFFVLELGTNSGTFNLLMRFASLNSYSAYNRVLIWRFGTKNVEKNPWFGIGYGDWERPVWMVTSSIDHYWLNLAVQFGIIPPVLIGIATVLAIFGLIRRMPHENAVDVRFLRGIAIALAVFALGAVSVALWLQVQVWFFVLVAIAVSVAQAPLRPQQQAGYPSVPPDEVFRDLDYLDDSSASSSIALCKEPSSPKP